MLLSLLKWIFILLFGWIISKRKFKIFFGSLAIMPLTLQLHMPYMSLLHLGILYVVLMLSPLLIFLFIVLLLGNFGKLFGGIWMVYCSFEQYL